MTQSRRRKRRALDKRVVPAQVAGIVVLGVAGGYSSTIATSPTTPPTPARWRLRTPVAASPAGPPPKLEAWRTSIGQSKRRRLATAARIPTCRTAREVLMPMGR